jgi:hypothetical protein
MYPSTDLTENTVVPGKRGVAETPAVIGKNTS